MQFVTKYQKQKNWLHLDPSNYKGKCQIFSNQHSKGTDDEGVIDLSESEDFITKLIVLASTFDRVQSNISSEEISTLSYLNVNHNYEHKETMNNEQVAKKKKLDGMV